MLITGRRTFFIQNIFSVFKVIHHFDRSLPSVYTYIWQKCYFAQPAFVYQQCFFFLQQCWPLWQRTVECLVFSCFYFLSLIWSTFWEIWKYKLKVWRILKQTKNRHSLPTLEIPSARGRVPIVRMAHIATITHPSFTVWLGIFFTSSMCFCEPLGGSHVANTFLQFSNSSKRTWL